MTNSKLLELNENGYCVLRAHFPQNLIEACKEAFWPVLLTHLKIQEPNRGPHRHYLPMPFEKPCFAPEFFFDPDIPCGSSHIHGSTTSLKLRKQGRCNASWASRHRCSRPTSQISSGISSALVLWPPCIPLLEVTLGGRPTGVVSEDDGTAARETSRVSPEKRSTESNTHVGVNRVSFLDDESSITKSPSRVAGCGLQDWHLGMAIRGILWEIVRDNMSVYTVSGNVIHLLQPAHGIYSKSLLRRLHDPSSRGCAV